METPFATPTPTMLRRSRAVLLGAVVVSIMVVIGTTLFMANYLRQLAERRIEVTTQNLVRSIEQNVFEIVASVDVALLNTSDELSRQLAAGRIDAGNASQFMLRQLKRVPDLAYLRATDERGNLLYGAGVKTPPINIADREYFQKLQQDQRGDLLASQVLFGRIEGKWVWLFARRINKPDGAFGGVVVAGIWADRLNEYFSHFQLDTGGSISLRDGDRGVIARYVVGQPSPFEPGNQQISKPFADALNSNATSGSYISGASSIDGISRSHSYRRNAKYDFLINVGISGDSELAEWKRQTMLGMLLLFAFIAAALGFMWILLKSWRMHEASLVSVLASRQALAESEERFRTLFGTMSEGVALHRLITDAKGQAVDYEILEVNQSFLTQTGFKREAVIGKLATRVYGVTQAPFLDRYAPVVQAQQAIQFEEYFPSLQKYFVVHAFSPSPGQFAAVFEDVTERKQLQAEQEASHGKLEEQYEKILQLQERLLMQALRDPLTDLHNRRYMDEALPRELARAKREGFPISLIMVDLDFFKRVNDTYGHAVGDVVLVSIASFFKDRARESDIVCRYGGEEFLLAMPHMTSMQACTKIDAWRQEIADLPILHGDLEIRLTISAGVAAFPEHGADIDVLLELADKALYQSKSSGRNRVTVTLGKAGVSSV